MHRTDLCSLEALSALSIHHAARHFHQLPIADLTSCTKASMATSILETVLHFRWAILASAGVAWMVGVAVYRRFFHPLAKVPGPAIAAITMLYQTCYRGKYFEEIGRMHEKYGPVVRINPDEVHLSDPENYDKIYYIGSKYPKGTNFYRATCVSLSTFGCESNEVCLQSLYFFLARHTRSD